jgi:hypothetical protein
MKGGPLAPIENVEEPRFFKESSARASGLRFEEILTRRRGGWKGNIPLVDEGPSVFFEFYAVLSFAIPLKTSFEFRALGNWKNGQ